MTPFRHASFINRQDDDDKSSSNKSLACLAGINRRRDRGADVGRCAGLDHPTIQAANKQRPRIFVCVQALVAVADGDGFGNFIGIGGVVVAWLAALDSEARTGNSAAAGDCCRMVRAAEPL